jgi:iron(III) transport system permease protein
MTEEADRRDTASLEPMTAVPATPSRARAFSATPGQIALALAIAAFLLVFLVLPVATVIYVAFTEKGTSTFTLVNFYDFVRTELFMRSLWNSFYVSAMSVVWASVLALPLAYLTTRFAFRGAAIVQTLGFLPLIMPPFVGAVAMQLFFGRNGSVNLLLDDWFGFKIDFMEGLNGVIFVQSVHYFPFILINLSAALRNIDRAMEEAAQNLGSSGFRLFRRIVFPLALPGFLAGASLVFVKVFDDLATPLLLNVKDMLAPQAYLRVTSIGIADPMGYVISVVLIVASVLAMWLSALALKGRDYATTQRGGGGLARRVMRPHEAVLGYGVVILILALVLAPHLGLLLLSFATIWSFSPLPDAYTIAHYGRVFGESSLYIKNTLIYAALAGGIDVVLGVAIAYLVLRTKLIGREWLDWMASAALAIPGVVLGIGYLRTFYGVTLPDGTPLASLWITIVLALAIRRLPYALRACHAALQQISVSLEEAAENLGATKARTVRRIVVPLMTGGILAGFVTSFATAAVELSATLMLVQSNSDAPLAYGLYVFMQSAAGRGPGAALGVVAVVLVAACTFLSHLIVERSQKAKGMGH